jgi:hypothetical protein
MDHAQLTRRRYPERSDCWHVYWPSGLRHPLVDVRSGYVNRTKKPLFIGIFSDHGTSSPLPVPSSIKHCGHGFIAEDLQAACRPHLASSQ